jgi:hypothetical protein
MINYVNGGIQRDAKVFSAVVGVRLIAWPPGGHYAEPRFSRKRHLATGGRATRNRSFDHRRIS